MKYWIISQTELLDKYLIANEKAIWITDLTKGSNIDDLIASKSLGTVQSIRYEDLKEIVFIDTDVTIELNFKDDKTTDEEFQLDKDVYSEIRDYLKANLKGTELKNYSVFKQIIPQLVILGIISIFTVATYAAAVEAESGGTVRTTGRRAWLKKIIASTGEMLGTTGTLIIGLSLIGLCIYFLAKKIKHPKKGEILKITNSPRLSI